MKTLNPLAEKTEDSLLISKAVKGDEKALESLTKRHEPFIYNLAWKYTNDQEEAKDLTQEALLKIITKLSTFKGESSFKTWVYRIVVNIFLETKRRPMESRWESFDDFSNQLNSIPSPELSAEEEIEQENRTMELLPLLGHKT